MVEIGDLVRVFGRIGIQSFGGPAAQIALMHKELVEDRPWLSERQYLSALSFCMLLPGPEAMQLATYAGWRLRGWVGGLIGGGLFVLPGALVMALLAMLYASFGALPLVADMFRGIQAAVVVIVIQALLRLGGRALGRTDRWVLAGLSFVGIFVLGLPFPLIIAAAAAYGYTTSQDTGEAAPPVAGAGTARTVAVWGTLWMAPVAGLWLSGQTLLTDIALFFSKLAIVTFGGAYAVLAYMTQEVVQDYGWITTAQMMDGLGLAETTPGPLILVTQFVGMLAGDGAGGWPLALSAGVVTLWVTFVPCFLWIFAGAPYVEWLGSRPRLSGALGAITAAVCGVILNLSVWFAVHVFFADVGTLQAGPLDMIAPVWSSLRPAALLLAAMAAALLLWRGWPLGAVLVACAVVSGAVGLLG